MVRVGYWGLPLLQSFYSGSSLAAKRDVDRPAEWLSPLQNCLRLLNSYPYSYVDTQLLNKIDEEHEHFARAAVSRRESRSTAAEGNASVGLFNGVLTQGKSHWYG